MSASDLSKIIDSNQNPLRVFKNRIQFFDVQVGKLLAAIQRKQGKRPSIFLCPDPALLVAFLQANDRLMQAAREVAPYVLPRITAIELTGKDGGPVEVSEPNSMDIARRIAYTLAQAEKAVNGNAPIIDQEPGTAAK